MPKQPTTKQVFVDVFTDNQRKHLFHRIKGSRGYLTSFRNDHLKQIAHCFLDKIERAVAEAYEEALAEDAELHRKSLSRKKP